MPIPSGLDQMPSLGRKISLWYGHMALGLRARLRPLASPVVFSSGDETSLCLCLIPDVAIEPRVLLPCLRRCATGYAEVTGLFCQSHSPYMAFGLDPGASRPLGVVLFRNPGLELIPG